MGLFDQDDIPIINSIVGNSPSWGSPQGNNLAGLFGLNKYAGGDPYSVGAQPIPTDVSGVTAQMIPPATGTSAAMPVASPTPNATPVIGSQAAGQVPMPTSAFQPGPQYGPPAPINVGPGPGAGYPTQPPMRGPVGPPVNLSPPAASPDIGSKANWLGHALGITSPQQGQNIASQFLSGLGAGMSAAGQYANKPGGAAFAGSFGAAMEGAQKRGDTQQAMAFRQWLAEQQQKQQKLQNDIATRKMTLAEADAAHKQRNADINADANKFRAAVYGKAQDDLSRWHDTMAQRVAGAGAWRNTIPGRENTIQATGAKIFGPQRAQAYSAYNAEMRSGLVAQPDAQARRDAELTRLDNAQRTWIDEQRKTAGVDPSKITSGTINDPHPWPKTQAEYNGAPADAHFRADHDGTLPNGQKYKKGDVIQRGSDNLNSPNDPPRPPTPMEPLQVQPQSVPEEAGTQPPSEQELASVYKDTD